MEGTTSRVHVAALPQVGQVLHFVPAMKMGISDWNLAIVRLASLPVEVAGDVQLLTADDDHLASLQQVLGHDGGQASNQVVATIDDDPLWRLERWTRMRLCSSQRMESVSLMYTVS